MGKRTHYWEVFLYWAELAAKKTFVFWTHQDAHEDRETHGTAVGLSSHSDVLLVDKKPIELFKLVLLHSLLMIQ